MRGSTHNSPPAQSLSCSVLPTFMLTLLLAFLKLSIFFVSDSKFLASHEQGWGRARRVTNKSTTTVLVLNGSMAMKTLLFNCLFEIFQLINFDRFDIVAVLLRTLHKVITTFMKFEFFMY